MLQVAPTEKCYALNECIKREEICKIGDSCVLLKNLKKEWVK